MSKYYVTVVKELVFVFSYWILPANILSWSQVLIKVRYPLVIRAGLRLCYIIVLKALIFLFRIHVGQ